MRELVPEDLHRVLKLAREQLGSGSDLDILYRLGYWQAVKDHTDALIRLDALRRKKENPIDQPENP
jgi:hypothetical protein